MAGLFLVLSGWQPIAFGINDSHPYAILGAPMLLLGFTMIIYCASRGIFRRQENLIVGLCGQFLLGIVVFVIPFLPAFPLSPFNFHTYSIVLGGLGIALSLESLTMLLKH